LSDNGDTTYNGVDTCFVRERAVPTPNPCPEHEACRRLVDRGGGQRMSLASALERLSGLTALDLHNCPHLKEAGRAEVRRMAERRGLALTMRDAPMWV
jgi:hypothetical protein